LSQLNSESGQIFAKDLVANKLRELISSVLKEELSESDWEDVLSDLENALVKINKFATGAISPRVREVVNELGETSIQFIASPASGSANAIALPIKYVVSDEPGVTALANFTNQYEGPPTCVHGGIIAAVFDELLGAANVKDGTPALTGMLKVRYKAPTPLYQDLVLKARVKSISERKVFVEGEIYWNGNVTAKAEGLFIGVDADKFLAIAEKNAGKEIADMLKQQWSVGESQEASI
jgi:acyl-coenzyme A thioesterase PaaI-like protein